MQQEIIDRIPQRDPFLYIEKILDRTEKSILTQKAFHASEPFFAGHFPGDPVVPGVILCEAAFQTGALLMSYLGAGIGNAKAVVTRIKNAKFKSMVLPEDSIQIQVSLEEQVDNGAYFKAVITKENDKNKVLTIEFACMLVGA